MLQIIDYLIKCFFNNQELLIITEFVRSEFDITSVIDMENTEGFLNFVVTFQTFLKCTNHSTLFMYFICPISNRAQYGTRKMELPLNKNTAEYLPPLNKNNCNSQNRLPTQKEYRSQCFQG